MQSASSAAYHWDKFHGHIPQHAVYAGQTYVVIRANHEGDWVAGKLHSTDLKAYIPWGSKEIETSSNVEVLVHSPDATVEWVRSQDGQVPADTVGPFGKDHLYVGRAVCPAPENAHTPGKIHPANKTLYLPFDGKEISNAHYEACVIRGNTPIVSWEGFTGSIPHNAVKASDQYVVIRAKHQQDDWTVGKLSVKEHKAYIPYDSKEVEVSSGVEILTHSQDVQPRWVPSSHGQQLPHGAVGPIGKEKLYVGRAVCPAPESVQTPGKVHLANKCLYLPFGGKEEKYDNYEVLVLARNH